MRRYCLLRMLDSLFNENLNCQVAALKTTETVGVGTCDADGMCTVGLDDEGGFSNGILDSASAPKLEAALQAMVLDPTPRLDGHPKALGEFAFHLLLRYFGNHKVGRDCSFADGRGVTNESLMLTCTVCVCTTNRSFWMLSVP